MEKQPPRVQLLQDNVLEQPKKEKDVKIKL
jgi:hypothetical protein